MKYPKHSKRKPKIIVGYLGIRAKDNHSLTLESLRVLAILRQMERKPK